RDLDRLVALVQRAAVGRDRGALSARRVAEAVVARAGRRVTHRGLVLGVPLEPLEDHVVDRLAVVGVAGRALDRPEADPDLPAVAGPTGDIEEVVLGRRRVEQAGPATLEVDEAGVPVADRTGHGVRSSGA